MITMEVFWWLQLCPFLVNLIRLIFEKETYETSNVWHRYGWGIVSCMIILVTLMFEDTIDSSHTKLQLRTFGSIILLTPLKCVCQGITE